MSTRPWLTPTLLAALCLPLSATGNIACNQLQCAEGTIDRDGECVPAELDPDTAACGEGTQLGTDGKCEPVFPPTVCDDLTTVAVLDEETGIITCEGNGTGGTCDTNLPCPSAASNKVSVCGRIYDMEDDRQLRAASPTMQECGHGGATDGPCEVDIKFYDALDFAGNPTGTTPLSYDSLYIDDCGRFIAKNVQRPQLPYLGIGTDDAPGGSQYRLTGLAFPVVSGQVRNNQRVYVVQESTNQMWSSTGGVSPSFIDQGVYMGIFYYHSPDTTGSVPVAGVTVTSNGAVRVNDDYYFTDTTVTQRTTVTANGPTGPNGAALMLNSSLVEHSGQGAEPGTGCVWPSDLAASIPGVLFFNPRVAEDAQGNECP
ncbi:MAG: hypothetical protein H6709_06325 [Kofleriaceae bacterium]|nr:hypothetical protein [Kofleriaceae bacterium]MCB9571691.1 hypothetical protein [Kofleriaceae bacterium]